IRAEELRQHAIGRHAADGGRVFERRQAGAAGWRRSRSVVGEPQRAVWAGGEVDRLQIVGRKDVIRAAGGEPAEAVRGEPDRVVRTAGDAESEGVDRRLVD